MTFYRLDATGQPEPIADVEQWAIWLQTADRSIASDQIGDVRISTVFLGLDHAFGDGPPVLWETMIFGGRADGYQRRYTSRADAIAGHQIAVTGEIARAARAAKRRHT